ncbi:histone-lysine N-methyltransferase SETMAR-like isoform X1 [Oratosquilla oratoria]|uniref:histone-lysine N-methyltransferase SETMAR-like isoform X1 n=1 Tax=Oratosquilla oratoria TaxID=337810 RepID=UPI003F76B658
MDFSKEGCRFYTFTRWKLGKKATEIREELLQVFPESTPSLETVSRWIRAFAAGKLQLEDDHRPGRPRTSVTKAMTVRARDIIDEDPTVSLRFLSLVLGVSYGSAHDIVHEHLGLRKKCDRWIPQK